MLKPLNDEQKWLRAVELGERAMLEESAEYFIVRRSDVDDFVGLLLSRKCDALGIAVIS